MGIKGAYVKVQQLYQCIIDTHVVIKQSFSSWVITNSCVKTAAKSVQISILRSFNRFKHVEGEQSKAFHG